MLFLFFTWLLHAHPEEMLLYLPFIFSPHPLLIFLFMQPETWVPQVLTKQVLQCYFGAEARKPLWNSKSPDPKMAHYPTHSAVLLTVGGKRVREKVREHTGTR